MMTTKFLREIKAFYPFYVIFRLILRRLEFKYGISIPYNTEIGPGFYIGHFGGIVVNYEAVIGSNCNINHGVTLGKTYGAKHPGTPRIKDKVYLGPGCKVIGGTNVGCRAAIGANSVVTGDVPDDAVVVGIPGMCISSKGSSDYVVNTV